MEGAERQRSFQDRLGEPLRDPLPRRIVRVLNRRPVPRSAPEVAEQIGEDPELTERQLRTLAREGVATETRSSPEDGVPTFRSAVIGLPKVLALLEVTKADDEAQRAA